MAGKLVKEALGALGNLVDFTSVKKARDREKLVGAITNAIASIPHRRAEAVSRLITENRLPLPVGSRMRSSDGEVFSIDDFVIDSGNKDVYGYKMSPEGGLNLEDFINVYVSHPKLGVREKSPYSVRGWEFAGPRSVDTVNYTVPDWAREAPNRPVLDPEDAAKIDAEYRALFGEELE